MAARCAELSSGPAARELFGRAKRAACAVVLASACAVGGCCLALSADGSDLEARALAMIALAFAAGPLTARVGSVRGESIRVPAAHVVLFAGALTLGICGATLPAAFAGAGRLLSVGPEDRRSIARVAYTVLKPAAACAAASAVYVLSGGNTVRPHETASLMSVLWAGLAYAAASALLTGAARGIKPRPSVSAPNAILVGAAWFAVLSAGWQLAVLYSVAPTYVLLVPIAAAAAVRITLRREVSSERDRNKKPAVSETAEAEEQGVFIDVATGLANRRYLQMFLSSELGRADRLRKCVSLAIFDIDGLQRLIESVGRQLVDAAVAEIGSILKSGLREYDVIARYAIGRLAVVLPEIGPEQALEVVQRLHRALEPVRLNGKPLKVSAGVASFPDHACTVEDLINSAHRALNRGRFEAENGVFGCERLEKAS